MPTHSRGARTPEGAGAFMPLNHRRNKIPPRGASMAPSRLRWPKVLYVARRQQIRVEFGDA